MGALSALLAGWYFQPMLWVDIGGRPVPQQASSDVQKASQRDRSTLLFVGDTYFGESYADPGASVADRRGYDEPLEPFRELLSSADAVIGNLEAPLTERDSILHRLKNWPHRGAPEKSAAALERAGFDAFSLANNHTWDSLGPGLRDTRAALERHGIVPFGAGPSLPEAMRPLRIELRARERVVRVAVIGALEREWDDFFSGAFATSTTGGTYPLAPRAMAQQIRALKRRDPELWVIVFPHWGDNYHWRTARQRRVAHALIAAGADLVIGHGAHVFQEVELTDGRAIVYSLGNFMFLSQGRYQKKHIHPWSTAARVEFIERGDALHVALKLYFIASDNLATRFRPHLLDGDEFTRACEVLLAGGSLEPTTRERLRAATRIQRDAVGRHLTIELGRAGR